MLFISRRISNHSYGLVSTDDNYEVEITRNQLITLVCDKGKTIGGVDTECMYDADGAHLLVTRIYVYQPPETFSAIQIKTSLLLHVDITVWNSRISGIVVRGNEITVPVVVRLSEFGSCCGDRLLLSSGVWGTHKATLVIDDGIKIGDISLLANYYGANIGVDNLGFKFDLREATDEDTVQNVYFALIDGVTEDGKLVGDPFKSVIDIPERIERFRSLVERELGLECCM